MRPPVKKIAVYNKLKSDIDRNIFPAGSCLPNEIKMAERYSVGRKTMRSVLAMLENENRITRDRRRGTIVCDIKRRSKTGILGVIGVSGDSMKDVMLLNKMDSLASKHGYHVISIECNKRIIAEHPEYLPSLPVDGFIFAGSFITPALIDVIRERELAVAGISQIDGFPELDWMENPHYEAFCEGIKYLKSLGHKRIAYIDFSKPPEYQCFHDILKSAFADILKDDYAEELFYARYDMCGLYIQYGERYAYENCRRALKYLMSLDEPPTALIAEAIVFSDLEEILKQMELSIPHDISLLVFSESKGVSPKYTAIEYDREQRLCWAIERLVDIVENGKNDVKNTYCRYRLRIGDTAAILPQLNLLQSEKCNA